MSQADLLEQDPVFQLKGSMLAITVMELAYNDLERLDQQLSEKVAQAPAFFSNTPLVLALDKLPEGEGVLDLPSRREIVINERAAREAAREARRRLAAEPSTERTAGAVTWSTSRRPLSRRRSWR